MQPSRFALFLLAFLLLTLGTSAVSAKDSWIEVKSKNFTLVGNASEKDIRKVGTRLEQFRETFRLLFKQARLATDTPTIVVVFKSDGSYKQFKPKRADGKIDQFIAGYFQPGEDVNYITLSMEGDDRETFNTIFHESVHAFVEASLGKSEVPTWFNEGLAEYYSTFEIEQDQKVKLGLPKDIHLQLLSETRLIPLDTFFNLSNQQMQSGGSHSRSIFYAQSWAIIHYLMVNDKTAQLGQFLKLSTDGKDASAAFKEAFKTDYAAFEKDLKKYVKQSSYQYKLFAFKNKLVFENEMTATPLDDAASSFYLGDLLAHIHRLDDAEPFLANTLKLQPNSTAANTALGFVKLRQRKFDEARHYLEAAIRSDAKSYKAYYEYAYLLSREGRDEFGMGKEISTETAAKIREAAKKAIALNPSFMPSYDLIAYLSLQSGEQLDEAVTLLTNGLKYKPGDESTLIRLAEIHMRQRKLEEAEAVALRLAKRTDDDDVRQRANRLASSIRQMREFEERQSQRSQGSNDNVSTDAGGRPGLKNGVTKVVNAADIDKFKAEAMNYSINGWMRKPAEGEQRVIGRIQKIECKRGQVVLTVLSADKTLVLTAKDFQGLQMAVFVEGAESLNVGCGADLSRFNAVVSYGPKTPGGEITAIEIVPSDFRLLTKEELNEGPPRYIVYGNPNEPPPNKVEVAEEEKSEDEPKDPDAARRMAALNHIRNSLAQPRAGEKREFGFLDKIECGQSTAFFIFRTGTTKLKLLSDPAAAPSIRLFTPDLEGMRFGCGVKPIDFPVVFVYKENPPKKKGDGTIVAVDFVPKSFTLN